MVGNSADDIAALALCAYSGLKFRPSNGHFTILASFVLSNAESSKVISLGTGSKCLPASRLPRYGEALHDSHAEVIARRGAIRWFLEEVVRTNSALDRASSDSKVSPWIRRAEHGKYALAYGVALCMYISTVPCGDASTRYLASSQDAQMAALKDAAPPTEPPQTGASTRRGRDNYSLYGVLRTKPGRADSPPTLSLSCSDKIAAWNVLGIQGALTSRLLDPIYIHRVVIGEVEPSMRDTVLQDCVRALYGRLREITGLLPLYRLNEPTIEFTSMQFAHSRSVLTPRPTSGCNDSLCWIADSAKPHEVIINGLRRGVPPKHRHNPKFRPVLSKLALYRLLHEVSVTVSVSVDKPATYYDAKQRDAGYREARLALKGPAGPFAGWVTSGREWENFDVSGSCPKEVELSQHLTTSDNPVKPF